MNKPLTLTVTENDRLAADCFGADRRQPKYTNGPADGAPRPRPVKVTMSVKILGVNYLPALCQWLLGNQPKRSTRHGESQEVQYHSTGILAYGQNGANQHRTFPGDPGVYTKAHHPYRNCSGLDVCPDGYLRADVVDGRPSGNDRRFHDAHLRGVHTELEEVKVTQ